MRGRPGRTERFVGGAVLGLTALILGLFLLTGGLFSDVVERTRPLAAAKSFVGISERPLFAADEKHMSPVAPPHEVRVARGMLPAELDSWVRDDVSVVPVRLDSAEQPGDIDASDLMAAARAFGARWLYEGRYVQEEHPEALMIVRIVDAGEPANAFGLWRSREPADSDPLPIGRAAWRVDGRCGFWAGRYATELVETGGRGLDFEGAVRAVAAVQLNHGGPFWADDVLPRGDRVGRGFRYVRQAPLGLDELADCWLADYEGGVTLGVMRPAANQADRMLAALRERLVTAEAAGEDDPYGTQGPASEEPEYDDPYASDSGDGGFDAYTAAVTGGEDSGNLAESLGPEAVAGREGDRLVAAYRAGPYLFVAAGAEASAVGPLAKSTFETHTAVVHTGLAAYAREGEVGRGGARFPEIPGGDIVAPTSIERYSDDVYAKINGKEGAFRAFHFVELRFARYADTRRQQVYDVYIYDMAEPVNAFGMYMSERPRAAEPIDLGREGYLSGANAYFWKNRYYVNVLGPAEGDRTETETALAIAGAIADTIADDGKSFWAESLLPRDNRVPHSFAYQATSGLTFEFLERVFIADYEVDGERFQMFLHRTDAPEATAKVFDAFVEGTDRYDTVHQRESLDDGGEMMVSESLGFFTVAFTQGAFFGGVIECEDRELAMRQAMALRESLSGGSEP